MRAKPKVIIASVDLAAFPGFGRLFESFGSEPPVRDWLGGFRRRLGGKRGVFASLSGPGIGGALAISGGPVLAH